MLIFFRHITQMQATGYSLILMDMFIARNYDMMVWDYCQQNNMLTVAIPKSVCVSIRVLNLGPMCRYSFLMLFIMQTRYEFIY